MDERSRATGCLLGVACGDALGRPVAGTTGTRITREYGQITEMRADDRPAGTVTGVTELTLRLARSLAGEGEFGGSDGGSVDRESDPIDTGGRSTAPLNAAGTAGLCRAVPPAVADHGDPATPADAVAGDATLAGTQCGEAAAALAGVLAALVDGDDPEDALAAAGRQSRERDAPGRLRTALAAAGDPSLATLRPDGDPIDTLEVALHDGLTAGTAEEAVVTAVNRGGEATVVGAATGAVAGARFGAGALPERWLDTVDVAAELRALAAALEGSGEQ